MNKENTTPTQNPGPVLIVYRVFPNSPHPLLLHTHTHIQIHHFRTHPLSVSGALPSHNQNSPPKRFVSGLRISLFLSLSHRFLTHTHSLSLSHSPKTAFLFKSFPSLFSLSSLSLSPWLGFPFLYHKHVAEKPFLFL